MMVRASFFLVAALSTALSAQESPAGDLSIERAWSRAMPAVAPNGAAYFRFGNGGDETVRIVAARSSVAERVEIHSHEMEDGVMKMRHIHSVEVPAQGSVSFEPGGLHVMLIGLKKPLVAGERFPLALELENGGEIEVMVEITSQ